MKMILLIIAAQILAGCAGREASSTDHHNRVPEVMCSVTKYQGRMHQLCCEGNTCVLEN
jgi:uncharacterized lipoprotein YmbA